MRNKETFITLNSFDTSRNAENFPLVKIDPYLESNIFTDIEKEKNWNYINLSKIITENSLKLHNVINKLQNLRATRNESEITDKILNQTNTLENQSRKKFKTIKNTPEKNYLLKINFPMKLEGNSRNHLNEIYNSNHKNKNNKNSSQNSFRNSIENKKISETERTIVEKAKNKNLKEKFYDMNENVISIPFFNHTTKIETKKKFLERKFLLSKKENHQETERIKQPLVLEYNKNISHIKSSSVKEPSGVPSLNLNQFGNFHAPKVKLQKFQKEKIPTLNFKNIFKENFSKFSSIKNKNSCEQSSRREINLKTTPSPGDAFKINSIGKIDLRIIKPQDTPLKYNTINQSIRKEENKDSARIYSYNKDKNTFMTNVEKLRRKSPKSKFETNSFPNEEVYNTIKRHFSRNVTDHLNPTHKENEHLHQISPTINKYEDFASEDYLKHEVVKQLDSNMDAIFIDAILSHNDTKHKVKNSLSIDQSNIFKKCRNIDLINEKSSVKLRNVLESTYKIDFKKNEVFGFDRSRSKIEPLSDRNTVNREIREIKNFKLKCMLNNLVKKANYKKNIPNDCKDS